VKGLWAIALFGLGPLVARGQEVTLPQIVVTGTFELRQAPSVVDLFAAHLAKQIESKRGLEEAVAAAPILSAQFWKYMPIPLQNCSSDSSQFFTPSYLTADIETRSAR
jgi:hypothetical protein